MFVCNSCGSNISTLPTEYMPCPVCGEGELIPDQPVTFPSSLALREFMLKVDRSIKLKELWLLFKSPLCYGDDLPHLIYYREYIGANRN